MSDFQDHIDRQDNPHRLTLETFNIKHLINYPLATRDQMMDGVSNDTYATSRFINESFQSTLERLGILDSAEYKVKIPIYHPKVIQVSMIIAESIPVIRLKQQGVHTVTIKTDAPQWEKLYFFYNKDLVEDWLIGIPDLPPIDERVYRVEVQGSNFQDNATDLYLFYVTFQNNQWQVVDANQFVE